VRAILLDTKGPEIRSGKLANDISGHATITFTAGEEITLHCAADSQFKTASTNKDLYIDLVALCESVQLGGKVLLDDGAIALTITSINPSTSTVGCVVDNSGELRSRAGVNLPLADTSSLPALSEKDKADIKYGMSSEVDIDFVAASL
jgi:pyruvate kinase